MRTDLNNGLDTTSLGHFVNFRSFLVQFTESISPLQNVLLVNFPSKGSLALLFSENNYPVFE